MKSKLVNQISSIIGGISLFLLVLSAIVSIIQPDLEYSISENRNLTRFERPDLESIIYGKWENHLESYSLDQYAFRNIALKYYFRIQDLLRVNERNGRVRGEQGIILAVNPIRNNSEQVIEGYVVPRIAAMQTLRKACNDAGARFISLQIPFMDDYYAEYYPCLYKDGKNDKMIWQEKLTEKAREDDFEVIDANTVLQLHNDEYLYYHTDHHYTYLGAYYVYRELLYYINNTYNSTLVFPDWEECEYHRDQNRFAGSYLKVFGDSGLPNDDYLEYVIPVEMPAYQRYEDGEESSVPVFNQYRSGYSKFMSGDRANTVIKTNRDDLPNVLLLGCSFTNALETMAIFSFNEMHSIDPRHYDGNICDYIRTNHFDYVVLVRNDVYEGNPEMKSTLE